MVRGRRNRPFDPDSPVVDLDRVLADDSWIDELARGDQGPTGESATRFANPRRAGQHLRSVPAEPLRELFDEWRVELTQRPLPPAPVLTLPGPTPVRPPGRSRRPRSLRPMLAIAAAIGAVVIGSATVDAANADPGSPMWPITRALWPDRAESVESAGAARSSLDDARRALDDGRTGEARAALWIAADELRRLPPGDERAAIAQTFLALWVAATPPQGSSPPGAQPRPAAANSAPVIDPVPASPGGPYADAAVPQSTPIGVIAANEQPPAGQQPIVSGPATANPAAPAAGSPPAGSPPTGSVATESPSTGPPSTGSPSTGPSSTGSPSADPASSDSPATVPETVAAPAPTPTPPTVHTEASTPAETPGSAQSGTPQQSAPTPPATSPSDTPDEPTPGAADRRAPDGAESASEPAADPVTDGQDTATAQSGSDAAE